MKAILAAGIVAVLSAAPVAAQDDSESDTTTDSLEGTVFDGDWLSVGFGAAYGPSYDGSDDYVVYPLPLIQGSLGGIDISPRASGIALDFIPDTGGAVDFSLGVAGRVNRDRASNIQDPVVEAAGELDTAFEVGPTAGVSFPGVLNPYDSLGFGVDALWDVAGAHEGRTINPLVTYFTPLSRGIAASLSLGATHVDDDYADYYYSVTPAQRLASGGALPVFGADGGFAKASATLFVGVDLNGNLADGGLALAVVGGYSRMLGDAKDTPFTRLQGDADQWLIGLGLGYTF